jgi:hypothetical protein
VGGTAVQLLSQERTLHTEVGVRVLIDLMVVAGDALVADLRELPALVQRGVVDEHVRAAQHVPQLDDVKPVVLEVG